MRDITRLRAALLAALASSPALLGCGGNTEREGSGGTTASGGSGGSGGAGATGATGGTSGTGGAAGAPTISCSYGTRADSCYSVDQAWDIANNPPQGGDTAGDGGGCPDFTLISNSCCNGAQAGWTNSSGQCCYAFCEGACCGRPFTVDGVARTARGVVRDDWLAAEPVPCQEHPALAAAWLRDALMEHASIASFARFSGELLALGAPSALVREACRAAADEIEHARLLFALASRFAGRALGPGVLDTCTQARQPSLVECAVSAFREGAVGETSAALCARRQLARALDPQTRQALERIADDEERHAALAWRFLAWALATGGAAVRNALARELSALAAPTSVPEAPAADEELSAFGRLTGEELRRAHAECIELVIRPCGQALLRERGGADASPVQARV